MENHGTVNAVVEPIICAMRGRKENGNYQQKMERNDTGTSNTLTSVQKDNLVVEPSIIQAGYVKEGKHQQDFVQHEDGICRTICAETHASTPHLLKTKVSVPQVLNPLKGQTDNGWHYEQQVYADYGITRAMKAGGGSGNIPKVVSELEPVYRIRKLTPKECFRLMGVNDEDIDTIQASGISNSSQYKLAGNSIVVDVLYHIFRKAFVEKENEAQQLTLF